MLVGMYGFGFWLPQIVKGLGNLSNFEVGLATALPYAAAALTMYSVGQVTPTARANAPGTLRCLHSSAQWAWH